MNLSTLTEFFGWACVISISFYALMVLSIILLRGFMLRTNARLFGVDETLVNQEAFKFVAHSKLVMTFFAFVPYLALRLMA